MLAEVLQGAVLAEIFELFRVLDQVFGLGEQAELPDSLVSDGLIREVPRMVNSGGQSGESVWPRLIALLL